MIRTRWRLVVAGDDKNPLEVLIGKGGRRVLEGP